MIVKEGNQEVFYESKKVFNVIIKDTDVFVSTNQGICHLKNKKLIPIQINTKFCIGKRTKAGDLLVEKTKFTLSF